MGDAVQRIRRVERFLPEGVGDVFQSASGIENTLRGAIQGGLDRNQIAHFVGERCDVIEWIFERERRALGIDCDGRDFAQRVGDGRQVALGVVARRVTVSTLPFAS